MIYGQEVYVITNRDIKSHRSLDLWLEYVDTRQVMPLFEQDARGEYTILSMSDVDWTKVPPFVLNIVRRDDVAGLVALDSKDKYAFIFAWLLEHNQKETLIRSFNFLMSKFRSTSFVCDQKMVLWEMVTFVQRYPVLALSFATSESWGHPHAQGARGG